MSDNDTLELWKTGWKDVCQCGHIRNDHVVGGGCLCHLAKPVGCFCPKFVQAIPGNSPRLFPLRTA